MTRSADELFRTSAESIAVDPIDFAVLRMRRRRRARIRAGLYVTPFVAAAVIAGIGFGRSPGATEKISPATSDSPSAMDVPTLRNVDLTVVEDCLDNAQSSTSPTYQIGHKGNVDPVAFVQQSIDQQEGLGSSNSTLASRQGDSAVLASKSDSEAIVVVMHQDGTFEKIVVLTRRDGGWLPDTVAEC